MFVKENISLSDTKIVIISLRHAKIFKKYFHRTNIKIRFAGAIARV